MFWIISILLCMLAILFVVIPLARASHSAVAGQRERDAANLSIYQDRLTELKAELADGHIDDAQFSALEAELSKTLLTDVAGEQAQQISAPQTGVRAWRSPERLIPVVLVLAMLPASVWLYQLWGFATDLEVAELFERSRAAQNDPETLRDLVFELGAVVERDQENGWAWYFMARNLVALGQFEPAALAFDRAATNIQHPQDQAIVLGQYAQALYIASGQRLTEQVQQVIDRAQRLNPSEPSVLQLLGANAFVNEDYQGALTYWQQLLTITPPGSDDAQFLRSVIQQAQQALIAQGEVPESAAEPLLQVSLALSPEIELPPETRVFISAQDTSRPGPPLAARVLTVADLPLIVNLSDSDAVGPFNLSSASEIIVVATASLSGSADVQSGDFQARSQPITLREQREAGDENRAPARAQLLISTEIP